MQHKNKTMVIGVTLSLLLLAFFGWLQTNDSKFLQLPTQWMLIAVFPVVAALFIGGFISSFKGFGVELESALKASVTSLNLTASDAVADIEGDEKRSLMYLEGLSREKKLATRWLLFKSGRKEFYTPGGVRRYMEELPNIDYFAVRSEGGDFVCFLPVSALGQEIDPHGDGMERFIQAIEGDCVPNTFPDSAISLKVSSEQGLVDVIRVMRAEKTNLAAVVSPNGKYLGVVFASEVEKRITDSVLATQQT